MKEILNYSIFTVFGRETSILEVLITLVSIGLLLYMYRLGIRYFAPKLKHNIEISEKSKKRLWRLLRWSVILLTAIILVISLDLDYSFAIMEAYSLSILIVLRALFLWQLAQLVDWVINNLFIDYFYPHETEVKIVEGKSLKSARKTVQYIFYLLVIIYILRNFGLDWKFYETTIGEKTVPFRLSNLFESALVVLIAQLFIWALIHLLLLNIYKSRKIDLGSQFAINQLIKYVIYTFSIIYALKVFGINITILLGGAAALLVGIGLGLQQTFNDFISGIVLLFERTVSVGDVLEFDGTVGEVQKIGLRASIVHTRQNVSMVVPNHILVNEKVINWTHFDDYIRFAVEVGVAYGSDTQLVQKLLKQAVEEHPKVKSYPAPFVRFNSFGNSSLDFSIYFFSEEYLAIEDVKSEIRLRIDALFRENNITIPFPQRVVTLLKDNQ